MFRTPPPPPSIFAPGQVCTALLFVGAFAVAGGGQSAGNEKPLTPEQARVKVNEKVFVELTVRAVKDRLEKRKEIYLDSEEDFRSPKNLAVVINVAGAARFKEKGIDDPATHFKDKTIRVRGVVTVVDDVPRILVEDPGQIEVRGPAKE
jgi:hypothetical protein